MSAGEQRINEIADCEFVGKNLAGQIARYAALTQQLAHDLARELADSEEAAVAAMRRLRGHPLLAGVDVKWRARRVARVLNEARELCHGVSAECVAFNVQFRAEFADALKAASRKTKPKKYRDEEVDI
ncbi:hypothetical protein [Actinophytocola sp.]|uniref:hypothetical protein n=1 Tax=Actinophytocola sp. TaxID=1872138 RepID=UPI002ED5E0D5